MQDAGTDHGSRKPTVLFMPEGSVLAHVGRCLAVAKFLPAETVHVLFAATGRHAEIWPAKAGYAVHPVYTLDRDVLLGRLRDGGSAFGAGQLRAYVEDELRVFDELKPDLVVSDFRPSVGISAAHLGIPHVCIVNVVWTRYCGFDLAPPESWKITKIVGKRILNWLRPIIEPHVFRAYARPFNRVRREYGLPELRDIRDCMCAADEVLLPDVPQLFPVKELPEGVHVVGPILWEPPGPVPDWLPNLPSDRKIVYVTMGSTGQHNRISGIASALLDRGYRVICTASDEGAHVRDRHEALHVVSYAPGTALCKRADVVVCHAGNGTIYQSLSQGKPVVGKADFHDQEFNVQRLEALRLGVGIGHGEGDLGHQVAAAVSRIMRDPQYAANAKAFRRAVGETEGDRMAASVIRRLIKRGAG